jgi:hypothetical protein
VNPSLRTQPVEQAIHLSHDLATPSAGASRPAAGADSSLLVYVASGTPPASASAAKRSLTSGFTRVDRLTVCDMSQLYAHATTRESLEK